MAKKKTQTPPQRKHVFAYMRASTGRQVDSIAIQRQQTSEYFQWRLKERGFIWGGGFEDLAVSGRKELRSRPGGSKLDLELQPGDCVIITKLDRAFRNARDTLTLTDRWRARGIDLHVLNLNVDTSTPMGKAMLTMAAAFAELESSQISERVRESIAYRKSQGRPGSGSPPYGLKVVRRWNGSKTVCKYAPDENARRIGKLVVEYRLAGQSFEEIYWGLLRAGERNRKGKEWTVGTLRRMFVAEVRLMQQEPGGAGVLARWQNDG